MELLFVIGLIVLAFYLKKKMVEDGQDIDKTNDEKNDFVKAEYSYEKKKYLVTNHESGFYKALIKSLPNDLSVVPKVRMADLLEPNRELKGKEKLGAFRRISQKHIDFTICERDTLEVVCCIELDDASHRAKDRIERDIFVNRIFKEAGIILHRIEGKNFRAETVLDLLAVSYTHLTLPTTRRV